MDVRIIAIYGTMTLLTALLFYIIFPFITAMIIGSVFAIVTYPLFEKVLKYKYTKSRSRRLVAIVFIFAFTFLFFTPLTLIFVKGTENAIEYIKNDLKTATDISLSEDSWQNAASKLLNLPKGEQIAKYTDQVLNEVGAFLMGSLENIIKKLPILIFSFLVVLLTMYFILVDGQIIKSKVMQYSYVPEKKTQKIFEAIHESFNSVILTNLISSTVQGVMAFFTALFTSAANAFLIGFAIFVMSFVPMVGTAPITVGLAIYYFYQDIIYKGVIWLIVGVAIGISDNVIKAYILKGQSQVHPYLGFLAVVGGLMTLGAPGVILGPLIVSIFCSVMPILYTTTLQTKTEDL